MATRKNIMLGTAGHVDHGKTALVRLLTGCETDTLAAEKERGLTIELGFAPCTFRDDRVAGIVDVPGHVDFIRNMVAGAQGVDVVIFVVAADDGVMPQTREHLDILTLMGIRRGLVALTKIDLVDEEMRELATQDVREFLAGTFLDDAPICPISNITGEGFEGFFDALNAAVDACGDRPVTGLFRMWIERTFTIRGFGTVVSGIPATGEVRLGQRLRVLPGGQAVRVRRMEVYGQDADAGRAGECVAMNLADVDLEALGRGQVLVESPAAEAVEMFEAELTLLPGVPKPMKDYAEVHLHVGTGDAMAHVAILDGKSVAGGESRMVQMRLTEPLGVAPGERFVVRAGVAGLIGGQVTTLGGGRVLDVSNVRLRRNRPWTIEVLAARRDAIDDPAEWAAVHLAEAETALTAEQVAGRAQMRPERAAEVLTELRSAGKILDAPGGRFAAAGVVANLVERIAAELEAFHAANPKRLGLEPAPLREKLSADPAIFDLAVERLIADGAAERAGDLLALAGRQAKLSPADAALCDRLVEALAAAGLSPPSPDELAETLGEPPRRVAEMLRLLAERGIVVNLDPKVVMHADAVAAARKVAVDLFATAGAFTTMEFRDALGVSRKYAVPLLDHFDTVRLTVRSGNRRTPGAEAKKLL